LKSRSRLVLCLLALSIGLFAACLPWDAFCVHEVCSDWPSWSILLFGILGMLLGSAAALTWLANPILLAAWLMIYVGQKVPAAVLSLAALVIGASFLLATTVITNEGGNPSLITGYSIGHWLWLASMAASCVAALTGFTHAKSSATEGQAP
jgi:hypothetical protein